MSLEIGDCSSKYKEIEGLKQEDVDYLLKWCEMQQYLPKITEMQIINFLHSNNFSNEAAKRCIDNFFTVRTHCPEFFTKRNPDELGLNAGMFFPFEKKSPEDCRIMMVRLIDNKPEKFNLSEILKIYDMSTMLILNKEGPAEGQILIYDLAGMTFSHVTKINLLQVKKYFFYLQECFPLKINAVHFINTGNIMEKLMILFRPFVKKELFEYMFTHQTMESIYKMIPKEYFPKDYPGGLAATVEQQQGAQRDYLMKNVQFFQEEEKQVVNEQLRPGKPKNPGEIFGVEGTFKKLDFD